MVSRSLSFILIIIVILLSCASCSTSNGTASPVNSSSSISSISTKATVSTTKAELISALNDLRSAMLSKVDRDSEITAQAFTDVKSYWRAKRWADIFSAPLRVIEDTLDVLAKAVSVRDWLTSINSKLSGAQTAVDIATTMMMVNDLQQVGSNLQTGLNGPTYIQSVDNMLEAADATTALYVDFHPDYYKMVIQNSLMGVADNKPLLIPRKSTTTARNVTESVNGAMQVRTSMNKEFNDLISEIQSKDLPNTFPTNDVITQIRYLKRQVDLSGASSVDVSYSTYLQSAAGMVVRNVSTKLGAPGSYYVNFGQIAGMMAQKVQIQEKLEWNNVVNAGENAYILCTTQFSIPGKQSVGVAQMATTLAGITLDASSKTFYSNPEEEFYNIPQKMLLSLPNELSNLWMTADDTCQWVRNVKGWSPTQTTNPISTTLTIQPTVSITSTTQLNSTTVTQPRSIPPTSAVIPTYAAEPLPGGIIIGDISMALYKVERASDLTTITLAFRRIGSSGETKELGWGYHDIRVTDDHGNQYFGGNIDTFQSKPLEIKDGRVDWAAVGFTWVAQAQVKVPAAAPITSVQLWGTAGSLIWTQIAVITISKWKPFELKLDYELQSNTMNPGYTFRQGTYLTATVGKLKIETNSMNWRGMWTGTGWALPIELRNTEYNLLEFSMQFGIQDSDGFISWQNGYWEEMYSSGGYSHSSYNVVTTVPAQSSKNTIIYLNSSAGIRVIILIFNGTSYYLKIRPELFG